MSPERSLLGQTNAEVSVSHSQHLDGELQRIVVELQNKEKIISQQKKEHEEELER